MPAAFSYLLDNSLATIPLLVFLSAHDLNGLPSSISAAVGR